MSKKLKSRLVARDISLTEIAKEEGVSVAMVSMTVAGKRKSARIEAAVEAKLALPVTKRLRKAA